MFSDGTGASTLHTLALNSRQKTYGGSTVADKSQTDIQQIQEELFEQDEPKTYERTVRLHLRGERRPTDSYINPEFLTD